MTYIFPVSNSYNAAQAGQQIKGKALVSFKGEENKSSKSTEGNSSTAEPKKKSRFTIKSIKDGTLGGIASLGRRLKNGFSDVFSLFSREKFPVNGSDEVTTPLKETIKRTAVFTLVMTAITTIVSLPAGGIGIASLPINLGIAFLWELCRALVVGIARTPEKSSSK